MNSYGQQREKSQRKEGVRNQSTATKVSFTFKPTHLDTAQRTYYPCWPCCGSSHAECWLSYLVSTRRKVQSLVITQYMCIVD